MSANINYLVRERITRALQLRGNTVEDLADETGISVGTLRSRLDGRSDFTITELGVIAYVMGERPSELLPLGQVIA